MSCQEAVARLRGDGLKARILLYWFTSLTGLVTEPPVERKTGFGRQASVLGLSSGVFS